MDWPICISQARRYVVFSRGNIKHIWSFMFLKTIPFFYLWNLWIIYLLTICGSKVLKRQSGCGPPILTYIPVYILPLPVNGQLSQIKQMVTIYELITMYRERDGWDLLCVSWTCIQCQIHNEPHNHWYIVETNHTSPKLDSRFLLLLEHPVQKS